MDSKITRNYLYNLSYQILSLFAPLITTPYVSRILGAEGVGTYSYTFSIVGYFSTVAALGIGTYGQLKISEVREDKEKVSRIFIEVIVTRLATTSICLLLYVAFIFLFGGVNKKLYAILSLNVIAAAFDISWFLQGLEEFKKTVLRNYIIKILSIVLTFVLVNDPSDLFMYALILQGSVLFGNATLWIGLKRYVPSVMDIQVHFRENLQKSFVYFIPSMSLTLYAYLDKTMIGVLSGSAAENGYYEQALKIQQIAMAVITSLGTVIMPRMAYMFKKNDISGINSILRKSSLVTMMFTIPMMLGLIAISDVLIPWFLGDDFTPSIQILQVLSFLILINGLVEFYGKQVLIPVGMQVEYNIITLVGVICNAILNYFFILHFNTIGACYASVLSALIILVLLANKSRRYFDFRQTIGAFFKYLFAGCVMFGGISLLDIPQLSPLVLMFCKVVIGAIVYFVVLLIEREEILWEFINKLRFNVS